MMPNTNSLSLGDVMPSTRQAHAAMPHGIRMRIVNRNRKKKNPAIVAAILGAFLCAPAVAQVPPIGPGVKQISVSCGTSSTTLLAAGSAQSFVRVHVPTGATASVWVRWDGATATAAAPAEDIPAGGTVAWYGQSQFLPTSLMTCIASSAQTVVVEYR